MGRQLPSSPTGMLYWVALLMVVVVAISPAAEFCLAFSSDPPTALRRPCAATSPCSPAAPEARTLMVRFSSTKKAASSDPPLDSSSTTTAASSAASSLPRSVENRTSTAVAPLSMAAADVGAMEYPNGETQASAASSNSNTKQTPSFPVVVWRFSRPHTLIGSGLAIPALHLLAAPTLQAALSLQCLYSVLYATVPALLMNLYITGLNQVTDVEIDKINKPNLPIAAGILSPRRAVAICVAALVGSLAFGLDAVGGGTFATRGLNVALWGSGLLGTLYSLPPVRLKRFPLLAAFCIVAVRGTIINASFFAHATQAAFGSSSSSSTAAATTVLSCLAQDPRCFWSSLFFGVFGLVIAIMKDVPDVLGDRISDIRTLSVRLGPPRIFGAARRILTTLLAGTSAAFVRLAVTAAASSNNNPLLVGRRLVTAACAAWAAVSVRQRSGEVDSEDPGQVYSYYMHLWKIFYLCYLVLPLAR